MAKLPYDDAEDGISLTLSLVPTALGTEADRITRGTNLLDAEKRCYWNIYTQMLRAAKLAKTPKKRLEAARNDCIRFARAIIARWPSRTIGFGHSTGEKSPFDDFPTYLLALHDRDTIAMFLTKLAERDESLRLNTLIPSARSSAVFRKPNSKRVSRRCRTSSVPQTFPRHGKIT